jgi:hypothetical protein
VFASFGRTDAFERINNWQRPYVSRIPSENFGHFRESHQNNRYKMCRVTIPKMKPLGKKKIS